MDTVYREKRGRGHFGDGGATSTWPPIFWPEEEGSHVVGIGIKKVKSFLCFLHLRSGLESEVSAAQGSGERGLPTGRPHLGAKHSSPGVSQGKDWVLTSWDSGQPSGGVLCL